MKKPLSDLGKAINQASVLGSTMKQVPPLGSTITQALAATPVFKPIEGLYDAIKAIDSLKTFNADLSVLVPNFQSVFAKSQLQIESLQLVPEFLLKGSEISKAFEEIGGVLSKVDWKKYFVPEEHRHYQAAVTEWGNRGWFILFFGTPLTFLVETANGFRHGKVKETHEKLIRHFRDCSSDLEQEICGAFPDRKTILQKALSALRCGDYELSIPVMLAQAEGIGSEVFGVRIYSRKPENLKSLQKQIGSNKTDPLTDQYKQLIHEKIPITYQEKDLLPGHDHLNRHEILHGVSTSYPSEINAYRAVSWLQYVASFKMLSDLLQSPLHDGPVGAVVS
jgi:hypothetical protein